MFEETYSLVRAIKKRVPYDARVAVSTRDFDLVITVSVPQGEEEYSYQKVFREETMFRNRTMESDVVTHFCNQFNSNLRAWKNSKEGKNV